MIGHVISQPVLVDAMAFIVGVGDTGRTRAVQIAIVALIALGVLLAVTAVWLFRVTRHDLPLLAPLELMGDRSWRRADPVLQRRRLDEVRPPGAEPLHRMQPVPDTDEEFDRGPQLSDMSDLHEPTDQREDVEPDDRDERPGDPEPVEEASVDAGPVDEASVDAEPVDEDTVSEESRPD